MTLKDQVFDCLPAGTYALTSLLQVVDVVESHDIPTAAIECRAQPRLLLNPGFVARYAHTPERLTMLVLHELHHVLLGHTRRFSRATPEDNFVFDAVINSVICRMFPAPAFTALLRDYYPANEYPACLLRPTDDWRPGERWRLPPVLAGPGPHRRRAGEVYRALYSHGGATYDEVRRVLPEALCAEAGDPGGKGGEGARADGEATAGEGGNGRTVTVAEVPLLGGHGHDGQEATAESPELAAIAARLVSQWQSPPDPIKGQSLAGLLREARVDVQRGGGNRAALRVLIGRIARAGKASTGRRRIVPRNVRVESPLPVPSRRSVVLRSLGARPLLFEQPLAWEQVERGITPLHVYVDVSGSVAAIQGPLYGAVLDCHGVVHPEVHLFSTEVHSVGWEAFRGGKCRSTGGTDIGCVARHIAEQRIDRAVVITDGLVGGRPDELAVLAGIRLGVAYTREHNERDLAAVTDASCVLNV
jgi:hypothetical protein